MPLTPAAQALADLAAAGPSLADLSVEQVREAITQMASQFGAGDPVEHVEELEIPGPDGPLRARSYRPALDGPAPVLLYLHGGGWATGDLTTADALSRRLAARAHCVVVNLDYRLAPEHPFPAAYDDACAAVAWLAAHAGELGADPRRIAVGGDSAGANLAAAVAQAAQRGEAPAVAAQLLLFPPAALHVEHPSMEQYAEGYFVTRRELRHWVALYAPDRDLTDPRLSPAASTSLHGLPPALVVTAECDPLRDAGEEYAAALREAGVATTLRRFDGQVHDFVLFGDLLPESDAAVDEIAAELRSLLD